VLFRSVDKSALEEFVHALQSENLDESLYTEETWSVFASALADAESVLANEDATQEEVDEALLNLTEAFDNLELIEEPPMEGVDKSALEELVSSVQSEDLDESLYTEETWSVFASALAEAESVLVNEDATQEEVDEALLNLTEAFENLELIEEPPVEEVDKSALEEFVHALQSENLDESLYTEETWSVFASALAGAEARGVDEEAME